MKKRIWRMTLGTFVFIYATGVVVAMAAFLTHGRYGCYAERGYIGIFWCPEVVSDARWGLLTAKSLIWPYYVSRAIEP